MLCRKQREDCHYHFRSRRRRKTSTQLVADFDELAPPLPFILSSPAKLAYDLLISLDRVRYRPVPTQPNQSPIFKNLRFPTFFQFRLSLRLLRKFLHINLYPFPRPQNLALQIETPSLLWIIRIEQFLKSLHHVLHIRLSLRWWFYVEDFACFLEGETVGGGQAWVGFLLCFLVLR